MARGNITRPELGRIHSGIPHHKQPPIRFTGAVFLNAAPQRRWGRCPQAAPGPHGVPGAEVNAKISVFWGRRQGGERQKKERRQGGGGHRRMGRRVGPGCWCELKRRKEEEREKISIYGKKNRRQYKTQKGGLYTAWTIVRSVEEGIRHSSTVRSDLRISVIFFPPPFFYLCNRRWGRRTRQRREERKDAVSRHSQGCREREEEGRKEGGGPRRTCLHCEGAFGDRGDKRKKKNL